MRGTAGFGWMTAKSGTGRATEDGEPGIGWATETERRKAYGAGLKPQLCNGRLRGGGLRVVQGVTRCRACFLITDVYSAG
jgi:hypothetical protein